MANKRILLPVGFKVSGIHCGIKKYNKDLGLIYSEFPCRAVGMFTKNKMKAAPVLVTKEILSKGLPIHAVIVNSGNANCCTGRDGTKDAKEMVSVLADHLNLDYFNVCVASTGIIGRRLPIEKILSAIKETVRALSEKRVMSLAKAILTTDKKRKIESARINIGNKEIRITGVCKGAGMVHPNMATMLAFIMTDADIDKAALKYALRRSVEESFNTISVDGDMSTNDCVLFLANGQAGNKAIKRDTKEFSVFVNALRDVTYRLAKAIVLDGEGATKLINIHVNGAKTEKDAWGVARTIANSCLVKTSVYGQDGNWGRVASSVGASLADSVKISKVEIYLDGVRMFRKGQCAHPSKERTSRIYKKKSVEIRVNLNAGRKNASMLTCDLTKRYIEINARYTI